MRLLLERVRWLLLGVLVASVAAIVVAQEPATSNRGINVTQGNITVSRGQIIPTTGNFLHLERTNLTGVGHDSNQTYSAIAVRFGWIIRDSLTVQRQDALPTAANLIAQFPGVHAGSTHVLMVHNDDDASSLLINGASTGVTYASSCSTAIETNDTMMVVIVFTVVTSGSEAMTAICVSGNS